MWALSHEPKASITGNLSRLMLEIAIALLPASLAAAPAPRAATQPPRRREA
jgi:hypothetical protein